MCYELCIKGWIQATFGINQLKRLNGLNAVAARRNFLAAQYDIELKGLPLSLPVIQKYRMRLSFYHIYVMRLVPGKSRRTYSAVFDASRSHGIDANLHCMPVHLQPYYRALGSSSGQFVESEAHDNEAITFPLFPSRTEADQDKVINVLRESLEHAS